jgi:hypothetical protein
MFSFLPEGYAMTMDLQNIPALTGYQFLPHPTQSTLGLLKINTLQGLSSVFLVDRRNMLLLSEALAQEAQKLEAMP